MLLRYFKDNFYNETPCERLKDGFDFPLPDQTYPEIRGKAIIEKQTLDKYPPTYNAIYLPFISGSINLCVQDNKDVLSSPFSGCHFVKFRYRGTCFLEEVGYNTRERCESYGFGCAEKCYWRKNIFVGHVHYHACEKLWELIKSKSEVFIDYDPLYIQSEVIFNKEMERLMSEEDPSIQRQMPHIYGLITPDNYFGSIIINRLRKVVWFDFKH